jgi:hypothetical protein
MDIDAPRRDRPEGSQMGPSMADVSGWNIAIKSAGRRLGQRHIKVKRSWR